jgi:hypothetical protein
MLSMAGVLKSKDTRPLSPVPVWKSRIRLYYQIHEKLKDYTAISKTLSVFRQ